MRVKATKTTRDQLVKLVLEELETRLCPTGVCDANPVYAAECAYLDSLLPTSQATITAVQSGNWSNPATWGGRLPTTGDNVWIPQGITVTVDKQEPGALRSILDNGVLTFAPNVNTSLDVNTLVTGTDTYTPGIPQGELDIGTAANPIQSNVTAQLIFADSQSVAPGETQAQLFPSDAVEQLSGGLDSMGTLNIYGSQVTPYVNMQNAFAGSTQLVVTPPPPLAPPPPPAPPAAFQFNDPGFALPNIGTGPNAYTYDPQGEPWTYSGGVGSGSGVAGNGSDFTAGNPNAPTGTQVAFIQDYGTLSQTVNFAAGSYTISMDAAQRANYQDSSQAFAVEIDGNVVGTIAPTSTYFASYSSNSFTVTAGNHTVSFVGLAPQGGDNTVFLGKAQIDIYTPPPPPVPVPVAGWKVGDTLLLPGTAPGSNQDEQVTIAGLQTNSDGSTTVTLATPLEYAHTAPSGQSVQVADENRSVIIRDEGTATQYMDGSDGQVMQMHNDAAAIQYASFLDPGRTDKSQPLGSILPNDTLNKVGRYSLHFHRDYYPGYTDNDPPIQVIGNFQAGGVGWGYDNHSSNVDFIDNVAYNDFGAAFVDEAGNELGSFQNNLAIDVPGVPNSIGVLNQRSAQQDYGWNGAGFWLTSPSTTVADNHVWDAQIGYAIWTLGLTQPGLGSTYSWNGQTPSGAPLAPFSGNRAGEVAVGLDLEYRTVTPAKPDTIDHFTAWGVTNTGILIYATFNTNLVDDTLLAAPGGVNGISTSSQGYVFGVNVVGADVEGFQIGYVVPSSSTFTVQGGYWNDATALYFPEMFGQRRITVSGPITFGPNVQTEYYLGSRDLAAFLSMPNEGSQVNYLLEPDQILLPDGRQLYAQNQEANYVPFPSGTTKVVADQLIGLTNAQLWAQYGIATGGFVAPADATSDPSTNALIGEAQTLTSVVQFHSAPTAFVESPYYVQYFTSPPAGGQMVLNQNPQPSFLQPGWNVLTQQIDGTTHSMLVYGTVLYPPSLPGASVGTPYQQSVTSPTGYTVSFAITSGAIPAGLTFSTSGNTFTAAGTPSATGYVTFNLTAIDPNGNTTTLPYQLTVGPRVVSVPLNWTATTPSYNPSTQTYDATITLTNNGSTTLTGDLMATITGVPGGATVVNAPGYYGGAPYFLVSGPGGQLPPGQSVSFLVQFRSPYGIPNGFGYRVNTFETSL